MLQMEELCERSQTALDFITGEIQVDQLGHGHKCVKLAGDVVAREHEPRHPIRVLAHPEPVGVTHAADNSRVTRCVVAVFFKIRSN